MAITFVAAGTPGEVAAGTSLVVGAPAGLADGDVVLLTIARRGNDAVTLLSGWAQEQEGSTGATSGQLKVTTYRKVASGEGASWTWTLSAGAFAIGISTAWRGAQAVDVSASQVDTLGSDTNVTAPTVDPTVDDGVLVFVGGLRTASTFTPPGGMTERTDFSATSGSFTATHASEQLATGNPTGTRTATVANAARDCGQNIVLRGVVPITVTAGAIGVAVAVQPATAVPGPVDVAAGSIDVAVAVNPALASAVTGPTLTPGSIGVAVAVAPAAVVADVTVVAGSIGVAVAVQPAVEQLRVVPATIPVAVWVHPATVVAVPHRVVQAGSIAVTVALGAASIKPPDPDPHPAAFSYNAVTTFESPRRRA